MQSTVSLDQGFGVVGELNLDGPLRANPGVVKGASAANIVVGRAFTIDLSDGQYAYGGTGVFGGILANPKALQSIGTSAGGPLAPTLVVPAGTVGDFVTMGEVVVSAANAVNIGDLAMFAQATGIISALPAQVSATGSISTTTLTIAAIASTSAPLAVGQRITGPNIAPDTYITALGTGTGGTGTYTVSVSQTAASGAVSADATAPSGSTIIAGSKFIRYSNTAAGLAVLALTGA